MHAVPSLGAGQSKTQHPASLGIYPGKGHGNSSEATLSPSPPPSHPFGDGDGDRESERKGVASLAEADK